MVLYGSITGVSVGKLFLAGFIPGVVTGLAQMFYALLMAKQNPKKYDGKNLEFDLREFCKSFVDVIPALIMPLIIIGGILSGIFTATEAGAIACVWGLLVGIFIYKEFDLRTIMRTMVNGIKTSGMVMLIVAGAMLFSYCLAVEQFPNKVSAIITGISTAPSVVLLLMIGCMLIIGCFMDATPAAIIMVPIFQPIASALGFNGIHFGLVIVLTLIMAGITPPVGVTLFVTSAVAKIRFSELLREMWPFIIISTGILFLIAYVPAISLWLPNLIG
jgi:C4-dicarboxylate transporter DctM subunit